MRRPLCSPPEDFAISPLLVLLPSRGNPGNLAGLTSSLYARYEKVAALHRDLGESQDKQAAKRILAEEAMLKQVLEWLEVTI